MFRVSYASALMYFLQKFHEGRPDFWLSVVYDEFLDFLEEVNSDENV